MKKFIVAVLALIMLLAVAATASATIAYEIDFEFSTPCQAIADNQLYNYHGDLGAIKNTDSNTVHVRHTVVQSDADETNRIAAYEFNDRKTMGANWHPSDGIKYQCMSNAITEGLYTAAGRGNTNYASKYGLNNITLVGRVFPNYE